MAIICYGYCENKFLKVDKIILCGIILNVRNVEEGMFEKQNQKTLIKILS